MTDRVSVAAASSDAPRPLAPAGGWLVAAGVAVPIACAGLIALRGDHPWLALLAGTALALVLVAGRAWRRGVSTGRDAVIAAMAMALASLLFANVPTSTHAGVRIVVVLMLCAGGSALLLAMASRRRELSARRVAIVIATMTTVAVLEVASQLAPGNPLARVERPAIVHAMIADPELGRRFPPDTVLEEQFAEPAGGYYHPVDWRARTWHLDVQPGSAAALVFPTEAPTTIRVAIDEARRGPTWHIQLVQSDLAITAVHGYSVRFQARADSARRIGVGFTQGHPPWQVVGFYRDVALTPEWQSVTEFFVAGDTDSLVRLQFDLGGSAADVEIAGVRITDDDTGDPVEPPLGPARYAVRHGFDGHGCRNGGEAPAEGAARVLVVGGAVAMGIGVHDEDTFAGLLERGRSLGGVDAVDILNCGVIGHRTREALHMARRVAPAFRPAVVVVVVDLDADRVDAALGWRDKLANGEPVSATFSLVARLRRLVGGERDGAEERVAEAVNSWAGESATSAIPLVVALVGHPGDDAIVSAIAGRLARQGIRVMDIGSWPALERSSRVDPAVLVAAHREAAGLLAPALDSILRRTPGLP